MIMLPNEDYKHIADLMPILCVDCVLQNSQDEYLLVKRTNEPLKGLWWTPGGRVVKGESLGEAAARKIQEELGIPAPTLYPLGVFEYHFIQSPFGLISGHHTVSFVFAGQISSDSITLDSQSSDWDFFQRLPQELDIYPFGNILVDPSDKIDTHKLKRI